MDEGSKITGEDYKAAKKMLKIIEKLEQTEFNEKENI